MSAARLIGLRTAISAGVDVRLVLEELLVLELVNAVEVDDGGHEEEGERHPRLVKSAHVGGDFAQQLKCLTASARHLQRENETGGSPIQGQWETNDDAAPRLWCALQVTEECKMLASKNETRKTTTF